MPLGCFRDLITYPYMEDNKVDSLLDSILAKLNLLYLK